MRNQVGKTTPDTIAVIQGKRVGAMENACDYGRVWRRD
jgi:hypothetical protein